MRTYFISIMVFLFPLAALAGNATPSPCMVWKNGKWQMMNKGLKWKKSLKGKKDVCVQYTKKAYKPVVDRLVQLNHIKGKVLPLLRKKAYAYESLNKNWKRSQNNWNRQVTHYDNLIRYNQTEAKTWRTAFLDLQKQKAPKTSWTQSPILWFAVGVVTTTAVTVVVVMAVNASK